MKHKIYLLICFMAVCGLTACQSKEETEENLLTPTMGATVTATVTPTEKLGEPTETPVVTVAPTITTVLEVAASPEPTSTPTPTPEPTSTPTPKPTNTPTPEPTATPTPEPTSTPTPEPTSTPTPEPTSTPTPEPTSTPTPEPTSMPTPEPTSTPTPTLVAEGEVRVELELTSECFTYGIYDGIYVCTGLSEKGYMEFEKYNSNYLVSIKLPGISNTGEVVNGFHSKSENGYDLADMLTYKSAYVELICADEYTVYYGVKGNPASYIKKLINVVLNDGLKKIGMRAFDNCKGLTSIVLPKELSEVGEAAFQNCEKMVIEELEVGGKKIGLGAFAYVTINKLYVSDLVNVSDYGSFYNANIGEVIIAEGIEELQSSLFYGCRNMKEVSLPASLKMIGNAAFENCTGLTTVVIPEGVISIGPNAFSYTSIRKLYIPKNVREIGSEAFAGMNELVEIEVDKENSYFCSERGVLYDKDKRILLKMAVIKDKTSFIVPEGVIEIDWGAFYGNSVLQNITIADTVKEIGGSAFYDCEALENVKLPLELKKIGSFSFARCKKLKNIIIPDGTEIIEWGAFAECENLTSITIPSSVIQIYSDDSEYWNVFYGTPNVTVITPEGSYAEQYAIEHGITVRNN